jgi:hypothetical protein
MALTKESLIEAAQVRAQSARRQARSAKADLKTANSELDEAITAGKPAKVRVAREHTRSAEIAITEAAENMGKVEGLLDLANGSPSSSVPLVKKPG